ncbi:hypothetical protein JCM10908_001320 [Rhodotorula pacifica]|uniref:uncharacterized protein n=1 Tax=Rhodotorula pacifica TaxID=1495444 RepID=UPI0031806408
MSTSPGETPSPWRRAYTPQARRRKNSQSSPTHPQHQASHLSPQLPAELAASLSTYDAAREKAARRLRDDMKSAMWSLALLALGVGGDADLLDYSASGEIYEELGEWLAHWQAVYLSDYWINMIFETASARELVQDLKQRCETIAAALDGGDLLQMAAFQEVGIDRFGSRLDEPLADIRWDADTLIRHMVQHRRGALSHLSAATPVLLQIRDLGHDSSLAEHYEHWYQQWTDPTVLARVNEFRTLEWDGLLECLRRIKTSIQRARKERMPRITEVEILQHWTPAAVEKVLRPLTPIFPEHLSPKPRHLTFSWLRPPSTHSAPHHTAPSHAGYWVKQLAEWEEDRDGRDEAVQEVLEKFERYNSRYEEEHEKAKSKNPYGW